LILPQQAYERYSSHNNFNVDEAAVMNLIVERTEAKPSNDFYIAGKFREDLMNNYGASFDVRENTEYTGASASGSGQKSDG